MATKVYLDSVGRYLMAATVNIKHWTNKRVEKEVNRSATKLTKREKKSGKVKVKHNKKKTELGTVELHTR